MRKYRARYDYMRSRGGGTPTSRSMWLTAHLHIHVDSKEAAVLPLTDIINLIAEMSCTNTATVTGGTWTLETKKTQWV